jgi:hypothetical protein
MEGQNNLWDSGCSRKVAPHSKKTTHGKYFMNSLIWEIGLAFAPLFGVAVYGLRLKKFRIKIVNYKYVSEIMRNREGKLYLQ